MRVHRENNKNKIHVSERMHKLHGPTVFSHLIVYKQGGKIGTRRSLYALSYKYIIYIYKYEYKLKLYSKLWRVAVSIGTYIYKR